MHSRKRTNQRSTSANSRFGEKKKADRSTKARNDASYSRVLPGPWQLNAAITFLCILGTAVLYAGDLHLGFFRIDDPQYILTNTWIQGVTWEHIKQILANPYYLNYSPLHLFSYMLDHAMAGLNAYAFHLSNNIWAGIVAGFVYLVGLALTRHRLTAIAAAVLFVVHPVHVEAVAWISSRKDLVAAAFMLPSLLAYLKYRHRGGPGWYLVSLFLFLLALLGKLSVVTFPIVFLGFDLFVEKRPLKRSIVDKIPFAFFGILIALAVQHAQPGTGTHPDFSMRAASVLQAIWLLTGFGTYVLYRVPPGYGTALTQIAGALFLVALFVLPLLLRKRYPLVTVLICWILFTYLPTQVLPFSYPVADRYLFLPSVGAAILIAWLVFKATDRLPRWNIGAAIAIVTVLSVLWVSKTVHYLSEWQDPRSVWYSATRKTNDFHVYYELGWEYLDKSAGMGTRPRKPPLPVDQAKRLASVVWKNDTRLPQLLSEISDEQHTGPTEDAFIKYLQTEASANFDRALATKGDHLMPDLFLSRGVLLLDKGELQSAKKEFLTELDEVSHVPSPEARQAALVTCYYNLAVAEDGLGNANEALSWIRLAEKEQNELGRTVIPGLSEDRQKLESIKGSRDHQ